MRSIRCPQPKMLCGILASVNVVGIGSPFGFGIGTDDKNSSRYLAAISQGGTTLPDRDYYLENDEKYAQARTALKAYIVRLYELAKLPHGDAAAENILKLETALAKAQWSRTELRDAEKRYNLYEVAKLTDDLGQTAVDSLLRSRWCAGSQRSQRHDSQLLSWRWRTFSRRHRSKHGSSIVDFACWMLPQII